MKKRTPDEICVIEDATVQPEDIETFLRLPLEQRFQILRALRHEASLLAGGGLGPMAGLYFAAVVASLPLLLALALQDDKQWAAPVSIAAGAILLVSGLYLTGQVLFSQRKYARSATRLAFYEDALRDVQTQNQRNRQRGSRWFRPVLQRNARLPDGEA